MVDLESFVGQKLRERGLRPTRQRMALGALLWANGDRHVSAEQLHNEAKEANCAVSMATVYNTLNQFVEAGLLKMVIVDAGRTYFDTNILPHHHFVFEKTGELEDIPAEKIVIPHIPSPLSKEADISSVSVMIRVN